MQEQAEARPNQGIVAEAAWAEGGSKGTQSGAQQWPEGSGPALLKTLLACVVLVLALALVRLARVALVLPMLCLAPAHALPCPCPFPCIVLGDPLPVHHGCMLPLATDLAVLHKVAAVDL